MALVARVRWLVAGCIAVVALGAAWALRPGNSAEQPAEPEKPAVQRAAAEVLGGPDRWLTYLSTDKPIYRGGEQVYVRGVVLYAHSRQPLGGDRQLPAQVQIKGPKGDVVANGWANLQDSVFGFSWKVPAEQAGGQYKVVVTHPWEGHPPAERSFEIRAYRAPRLRSQIEFVRDGYGPGDSVAASLKVTRAEGGVPDGAKVTVIARVDGAEVFRDEVTVSPDGTCGTKFALPAEIARGEGTLAFVVEDGGVLETASKTIPILLQTVDLAMYPEGGDLVAGLPNRVYIEAKTPARKPADIAGEIVDAAGKAVAAFRTEHEGRGRVTFTPEAGIAYTLRITEPAGIKTTFPLPEAKADGVVIRALDDVVAAGEAVRLELVSAKSRRVQVTLSRREEELFAARSITLTAGKTVPVSVKPRGDGILIATVWDEHGRPLAERLVFRQPAERINVAIEPDQSNYMPGGRAALKLKTTNAKGEPVEAVVGVTVTDDSVLEMIETREQAPRLPVIVLLESDVRELADAHVYLDAENPEAPLALDLLLGTQGWRRFAFVDTAKFIAEHGDAARRVLALKMPTQREQLRGAAGRFRLDDRRGEAIPLPAAAPAAPLELEAAVPQRAAEPDAAVPEDKAAVADEPAPAGLDAAPLQQVERQLREALEDAGDREARDELIIGGPQASRRAKLEGLADRIARPSDMVLVREYAHQTRPDRQPGDRADFTETLYWSAGVKTDARTGEASVSFALNDSVTSFRVFADAFDAAGALGQATTTIESVEPFYVEPKLPLEITSTDRIQVPVSLVNSTGGRLAGTQLEVEANGLEITGLEPLDLDARARIRRLVAINAAGFVGETDFTLTAKAGPYSDRVTRKLRVKAAGFPAAITEGGMLSADGRVKHELVVPDQIIPGSLTAKVSVFPTPLANLTEALQALIREPYGCFEQTSSTTYPLVMAQQYFQSHTGVDPALIQRSNEMLGKGYERLIGFECKGGGFEWFGADPGHEALSAYGLMEFTDMAQVREVDREMLARTRKWLLGRRDGQGGFTRERRALHTWLADADVSNAYITWALLSAGEQDLTREVEWVRNAAGTTKNSYVLALAANVLVLAGQKAAADELLDKLIHLQSPDGSLSGATTSIVGSGGEALVIETTALAALAWLSDPDYIDFVDKAVRFLSSACKDGRFGSTQSTVLALKAIVEQDKALARPKASGSVQLIVDGQPFGEPIAFDTNTQGAIQLPDMAGRLSPGRHTVELKMTGGSNMPYAVAVNVNTLRPASSEECQVRLDVSLADESLDEGGITEARVACTNTANETVPTPVAIIGIPGGLEVRHDQLKELVNAGRIAAYEVLGREVVLYWRELQAGEQRELPISLVAALPGEYTGPASRAYLYYTDEHKQWAEPLRVEVRPAAQ